MEWKKEASVSQGRWLSGSSPFAIGERAKYPEQIMEAFREGDVHIGYFQGHSKPEIKGKK